MTIVPLHVSRIGHGIGNCYYISETETLAASAQDIFTIVAPSTHGVLIAELVLYNTSGGASNNLTIGHTTGATAGSGGSAVTGIKGIMPGLPSPAATYEVENTTQATVATAWFTFSVASASAFAWRTAGVGNLRAGHRHELVVPAGGTFVVSGTPNAGTHTIEAWVEEIPYP